MKSEQSAFERLLEPAAEQHGFVRVPDAEAVGVAPATLIKLAAQGRLEHRGHGLYRLATMPATANDEYHEAALWPNGMGVVAGEAALALWDLADVNPRKIDVVVPPTYNPRRKGGERYRFARRKLAPNEIDEVDNIPVITPERAIRDAMKAGLANHLIEQAITTAARRELIDQITEARLRVALADRVTTTKPGP